EEGKGLTKSKGRELFDSCMVVGSERGVGCCGDIEHPAPGLFRHPRARSHCLYRDVHLTLHTRICKSSCAQKHADRQAGPLAFPVRSRTTAVVLYAYLACYCGVYSTLTGGRGPGPTISERLAGMVQSSSMLRWETKTTRAYPVNINHNFGFSFNVTTTNN
ncbi:unnamed protein product, partial [Ectocarpus fasciculatus]